LGISATIPAMVPMTAATLARILRSFRRKLSEIRPTSRRYLSSPVVLAYATTLPRQIALRSGSVG
jgi:hypothetical protein